MTAVPGVSPVGVRIVYDITTQTALDHVAAPATAMLGQNYPNPTEGMTSIPVLLPNRNRCQLSLYDLYGRRVAVLHDGMLDAGMLVFRFDARTLAPGMYFVSFAAAGRTETRMMFVVR